MVDVEVVRVALDDRQSGQEGRVEERRRELAEPTPHAEAQDAVVDHGGVVEATVHRAWAEGVVQRKDGARLDHGAVDELGGLRDVLRTGFVGLVVVGRELRAQTIEPESRELIGRHGRLEHGERHDDFAQPRLPRDVVHSDRRRGMSSPKPSLLGSITTWRPFRTAVA